jgi:hypothetical protein
MSHSSIQSSVATHDLFCDVHSSPTITMTPEASHKPDLKGRGFSRAAA